MKKLNRSIFLGLALLLCACQSSPPPGNVQAPTSSPSAQVQGEEDHGHEHTAPHGGTLVLIGDHFAMIEILWDQASGKVTLYVLDGEAEKPLRCKQEKLTLMVGEASHSLQAVANSLTGETVGDSSQFEGTLDSLKGRKEWQGDLLDLEVRGSKFAKLRLDYPKGNH